MQVSNSSDLSLNVLQQMFATLQTDLSSITGQFGAEAINSSANTAGSTTSTGSTSSTGTTAATPSASTPSTQFANDTLSALIQAQSGGSWASNAANTILSADGANGEISLSQVENALQSSGSTDTTAQITSAFNSIDANGDGELSASELTTALQQLQQQQGGVHGHHGGHHHHGGGGSAEETSTTDTTDVFGATTTSSTSATASIASTSSTTTTTN